MEIKKLESLLLNLYWKVLFAFIIVLFGYSIYGSRSGEQLFLNEDAKLREKIEELTVANLPLNEFKNDIIKNLPLIGRNIGLLNVTLPYGHIKLVTYAKTSIHDHQAEFNLNRTATSLTSLINQDQYYYFYDSDHDSDQDNENNSTNFKSLFESNDADEDENNIPNSVLKENVFKITSMDNFLFDNSSLLIVGAENKILASFSFESEVSLEMQVFIKEYCVGIMSKNSN